MEIQTANEDKNLVLQLRNNSIIAFDALFHKYSDRLYAFSVSILKNQEESKEVVQEVFTRIWEKRSEINPSKSFKSFIFTISYNLVIDHFRLKLKDKEFKQSLYENTAINQVQNLQEFDLEIITAKIKQAVGELPEKRKRVFLMSREDGMTQKEIAKQLGISVKTVENQINLSLRYIRKKLGNGLIATSFFLYFF